MPPMRNRKRDFWQLDVPLAIVLVLCTVITLVEVRRAGDGVWRAWVYMVEWPMIGAFAVWIWHRFRTEGNPARGVVRRWQERVEQAEADYDAQVVEGAGQASAAAADPSDPQLAAWQDYVADLQRRDPPGGPPDVRA